MKLKIFLAVVCLLPFAADAADRGAARVGMVSRAQAGSRASTSPNASSIKSMEMPMVAATSSTGSAAIATTPTAATTTCRDAYRACMDEFCLLDESEGERCACSANINQSKTMILDIQKIQDEADKMFTTDVERESLGIREQRLIFGESAAAKKASAASGLSFADWIASGETENIALGADNDIGDGLYQMAAGYCATQLATCGDSAEMEKMLYSRQIINDCKSFDSYLGDQKRIAEQNKQTAEAAVRATRLKMLGDTNQYNRGECLLAYKSCIADKGGCGANFENCLDADLLQRRANACENVLDNCNAVRTYVVSDWDAESKTILVNAAQFADQNRRQTCFAKIQLCLEDGCSTGTNSACLTNVNVAAGICPIIDECDGLVPGIKQSVNANLGFMRSQFCTNDVNKCLAEKCGTNFTAPECLGKKTSEITALCPQKSFPSCNGETQFNIIVSSAMLDMNYQMLQGCLNYFGEQLGAACGTDMSCLPSDETVATLTVVPSSEQELRNLRATVRANAQKSVDDFMKKFESDQTVAACRDAQKPVGRSSLGANVFTSAKLVANIGAENRALRALESKIAELSRAADVETAQQNCLNTYKVETPDESDKNYSYIRSVSFEPSLRNCHICRMQQVCEVGGESKASAGVKGAAGGLAAGAAAGTMVVPGWGTAIGAVVGGIGGLFAGRSGAGKQEFCQEIESCEDVNF